MSYDVVGIGNAIVDILAPVEDSFLAERNIPKGAMTLIDADTAEKLYADMGSAEECAGGSVANSIAALSQLGTKTGFMGRVKHDALGSSFRASMQKTGVAFNTPAASEGSPTGRCFICVTPDAERTMNTFIGACAEFASEDVDEQMIAESDYLYIEGYLWDQDIAKEAIQKATKVARAHDTKVALSLSDAFCVDRHRDSFNALIDDAVDILFANEQEAIALSETSSLEAAAEQLQNRVDIAALTQGADGVTILSSGMRHYVPAPAVSSVVDTTGAGDLFAAGFLYGLVQQKSPVDAAGFGHHMAGKIIQQMGARADFNAEELAA